MLGSQRLIWGLAIGLQFCCAGRLLGQAVDVFVDPASQSAKVGDPVSVEIRLNTNARSVCLGGVFLQFDTGRLNFVNGANNTATWNLGFLNVEPAQTQPGIVSLDVGAASAVNSSNALISTLHFTATSGGPAGLSLLFNAGHEETQFFAADCTTTVTTNRTGGTVSIAAPPTTPSSPTLTPTSTPPFTAPPTTTATFVPTKTTVPTNTPTRTSVPTDTGTPTPTRTPTPVTAQCAGDCDGSGEVTVDEIIILVNIALGTADASACPHGIPSGEAVDITLIIKAVGNALNNCPVASVPAHNRGLSPAPARAGVMNRPQGRGDRRTGT